MKAYFLVKNGPASSAFELREAPMPVPAATEVLIKAQGFGLNYADVMARLGLYEDCPKLPCVLGYEVVGHVEAIGSQVTGVKVGDRVTAMTRFGGYAQYVCANMQALAVVPEDLSLGVAAALATQYGTSWYCAEEMVNLHKGDTVLIHAAAGGVGMGLVQLALRKGCTVIGTAGSDDKLKFIKSLGAQHAINYRTADWPTEVKKIVCERGLDVIFDSIGGASVKKGIKALGSGGRIVCYGAAAMSDGNKRNLFNVLKVAAGFGLMSPIPLLMKSKSLLTVNMLRIADDRPEMIKRCLQSVVDLCIKGELEPIEGALFSHTDLAKAHNYLAERKSIGKVAITW